MRVRMVENGKQRRGTRHNKKLNMRFREVRVADCPGVEQLEGGLEIVGDHSDEVFANVDVGVEVVSVVLGQL
jgi:hypothetical protein